MHKLTQTLEGISIIFKTSYVEMLDICRYLKNQCSDEIYGYHLLLTLQKYVEKVLNK